MLYNKKDIDWRRQMKHLTLHNTIISLGIILTAAGSIFFTNQPVHAQSSNQVVQTTQVQPKANQVSSATTNDQSSQSSNLADDQSTVDTTTASVKGSYPDGPTNDSDSASSLSQNASSVPDSPQNNNSANQADSFIQADSSDQSSDTSTTSDDDATRQSVTSSDMDNSNSQSTTATSASSTSSADQSESSTTVDNAQTDSSNQSSTNNKSYQVSTTDDTKPTTTLSETAKDESVAASTDTKTTTPETATPTNTNDNITVPSADQSTDQTINPTINGLINNLVTDVTSFAGAAIAYPFVFTRVAQFMSDFRTLLSPDRYNIDQMWNDLDEKYNPEYSKAFYTEAKDWYDNKVAKETWSIPFYDDKSKYAKATYIKNGNSTKTIIYGQGWTTDPNWMGYISKVFYDMGYNVLITYTRGQNTSDGAFITYGAKDKYDWQNWIKKVDETNGPNSQVVLYGQSMGADTALEAASVPGLSSSVKAVIADCGYSTMPALAHSLYEDASKSLNDITSKIGINLNGQIPLLPFNKVLNSLNALNQFFQGTSLDDISGITAVQNAKVPTLFISTADDAFIPTSQTQTLYQNSAASLKELWVLDGNVGGHASANNAVIQYQQHIEDFVAKAEQSNIQDTMVTA